MSAEAMRRDICIENGRGDATEVPAEVLVVGPVGYRDAAGHANQQLMDDQPLGTKRHELVRRQPAIAMQLVRVGHAGRNVLRPEDGRKRHKLARQLRFQARIPGPVLHGSRSVVIVHLHALALAA